MPKLTTWKNFHLGGGPGRTPRDIMKVALLRPPQVNPYWYLHRPSLGISYLAAYLINKGIETKIFDAIFNSWDLRQTVQQVCHYHPDLIGISSMTHEIRESNHLAEEFKKRLPGVPLVIGGCHLTALLQETFEEFPNFDYGIYREGEKPLLALVEFLKNGKGRISHIPNLVYRTQSHQIRVNPPGAWLTAAELNQLPYPAFDQYYPSKTALGNKNTAYPIMSSRGCPYQCAFCMQVLGRQLRRRSPENIVAEIEHAIKCFGANTIQFWDDIFLLNDGQTMATLDLMIRKALQRKIRWNALTRVDQVDEKLIFLAKKAGCYALDLGVESGSDKILKRINKQITVAQIRRAVKIIKEAGIATFAYFILGHPGETKHSLRQTTDLAVELNTDQIAVGIMVPYPGTQIYEMAKKGMWNYRLLSDDWSKYDKYGGSALELKNLPLKELERWQRRVFLEYYLRNWRFIDLLKFVFNYRKEIFLLLFKK